jgi:LysM repeat protein
MKFERAMTRAFLRRTPVSLMLGASALLFSPAESLAAGLVRFIHAVPSAGEVTVEISQGGSEHSAGHIRFGQVSPWSSIKSGKFEWALVAGGKTLAHGSTTVSNGAYDLVFLAKPAAGVSLGVYKAEGGKPGVALIRMIHAAPELGSPRLRMDDKTTISSLAYTQVTPYLEVAPGVHTLSASPTNSTQPLLSGKFTLAADNAYSEIIIGSAGQRVRAITVVDRGAPLTRAAVRQTRTATSGTSVEVRAGDSLWQIARDHLGPSASNEAIYRAYTAIWNLNKARIGTGDPNLIFPGQRISLPTN